MGLNDVIPGGIDLGALRRLVGAPEEADGVKNLDELLDRVANAQQLATVANQGKEQAWRERDDYLAKLSEVAKGRDGAYAKLDQAQGEITSLRAEVGELRFALESTRKENGLVNSLLESVVKERDEAQRKLSIASGLVDSASPIMLGLAMELDEARASLADARAARDGLAAALGKAEARIDDLEAVAPDDEGDKEPPLRHLHCCECEQCQPPQRGCIIINIFRAEGHCPTINVGGKGEG